MATIQISKIQLRRGPESDLPGAPTSLSPLVFSAGLDDGELGFTDDTGRLFIGQNTPANGMPNYLRQTFPYQNIEVLTENSPFGSILAPVVGDNQTMFITAVPMPIAGSFTTLQVNDANGNPQDFYLDFTTSGVNAIIAYFVFDNTNNAVRQGVLKIVWNSTMATPPLCIDEANAAVGALSDLQWTATVVGSSPSHVVLQYKNQSGGTLHARLRVDRPTV